MDRYDPYTDSFLRDTQYNILGTNLAEVGTDCISRQAALDAIRPLQTYKLFEGDDMILVDKAEVQTELMMLPTAQPEPCEDAVSRKDMLAELDEWREAFDENGHKESCSDMKLVRKFMALLPSAQPEPAQWVQMLINPRMYKCSNCGVAWNKRLVFDLDNHNEMFMKYCPCCGKKMLPEVDYE